jgi:hypothetical protein
MTPPGRPGVACVEAFAPRRGGEVQRSCRPRRECAPQLYAVAPLTRSPVHLAWMAGRRRGAGERTAGHELVSDRRARIVAAAASRAARRGARWRHPDAESVTWLRASRRRCARERRGRRTWRRWSTSWRRRASARAAASPGGLGPPGVGGAGAGGREAHGGAARDAGRRSLGRGAGAAPAAETTDRFRDARRRGGTAGAQRGRGDHAAKPFSDSMLKVSLRVAYRFLLTTARRRPHRADHTGATASHAEGEGCYPC